MRRWAPYMSIQRSNGRSPTALVLHSHICRGTPMPTPTRDIPIVAFWWKNWETFLAQNPSLNSWPPFDPEIQRFVWGSGQPETQGAQVTSGSSDDTSIP